MRSGRCGSPPGRVSARPADNCGVGGAPEPSAGAGPAGNGRVGTGPGLLRAREAAAYLGITIGTLRGLIRRGEISHRRIGQKLIVFCAADLDEYLERCKVPARADEDS